jgi:hypothetical protein
MRRLVPFLSAILLAGCMTPTWKSHLAGSPLADEHVILVGSFTADPPFTQERQGPAPRDPLCYGTVAERVGRCTGGTVLVGGQGGNLMGYFTPDLSENMRQSVNRMPFDTFDWAWMPLEGAFVIEVPRRPQVLLRGVQYYTKGKEGAVRFELPARVDVRPGDRVVYVGEIEVVQKGERRVTFNDRLADTRKALEAAGYSDVLALPWRTQLFAP